MGASAGSARVGVTGLGLEDGGVQEDKNKMNAVNDKKNRMI
jgi:hypothetical protein